MIYLFNSACKQSYFANVYRLVGKPAGVRQEIRYTEGQNSPPIATDTKFLKSACTICYVDRYAEGGYKFYPFRMGKIRNISRTQGRVYYDVELGRHCHAPSPDDFTSNFYSKVDSGPRLVGSNPESSDDGIYCTKGPGLDDHVKSTGDSWAQAVDQIYGTFAFRFGAPAFFLAEITRKKRPPPADELGLRLKANTEYRITVMYRLDNEHGGGSKRGIHIRIGNEINHEFSIGSRSDRIHVPIKLPPTHFTTANISIRTSVDTEGSSGGSLDYSIDIPFRARTRRVSLVLQASLFAAIYLKQAWLSNWQFLGTDTWLLSAAEFVPFAIILWAIFKFRSQVKLTGL
ncbi:MAG: hypothetical protein WD795_09255 [Woeseia sp.]